MLALLIALATPSPAPTQPPEILHVVVSPVCATIRQTVVPVGQAERHNDSSFVDAYTQIADVSKDLINLDDNGRVTKLTYLAHQTQADVGTVFSSIEHAQKLIDASRRRYPDKAYPQVARLRDRLEDVLEWQRKYNSMLDTITGSYLDNQGPAALHGGFEANSDNVYRQDVMSEENYINGIRALFGQSPLDLLPHGDQPSDEDEQRIQNEQAAAALSIRDKDGTVLNPVGVRVALHNAEGSLVQTVITAAHGC